MLCQLSYYPGYGARLGPSKATSRGTYPGWQGPEGQRTPDET